MDATERMLVGAAMLLVVFAVTLMAGYVTPPEPPDILSLSPRFMQAALSKSRTITEQDLVAGMALEGLSSRR